MPQADAPADLFNDKPQHLPPGTGTLGMVLFLISLGMLFAALIAGYLLIRLLGPHRFGTGTIHLPWELWLSTAIMILSSYTMHRSLQNVRIERQRPFRNGILFTLLLGIAFLAIQAPSLYVVLKQHWAHIQQGTMYLYGLVFVLIVVHACHVIGGLLPLSVITTKAWHGRYDHEHFNAVKYITMYWHFLDAAWIIMFAVLLLAR